MTQDSMTSMFDTWSKMMTANPMTAMLRASQKAAEDAMEASSMVTDAMTVVARRNQQVAQTVMNDAMSCLTDMSKCGSAKEAMAAGSTWMWDTASRSIDNMNEATQVLAKSGMDTQKAVSGAMQQAIDSCRKATEKACSACATTATSTDKNMFWWPQTSATQWWSAWMPAMESAGKEMAKAAAKTAEATSAVIQASGHAPKKQANAGAR